MPVLRAELLKDLLLCGAIVWLLWVPLGRWALSRIGRGNLPDPQALALTLGMGAWGYLILMLGLAGALYKIVLVLITALLFLTLRLHRHWKPVNPPPATAQTSRFERIFILVFTAISAAYSGLVLASALAPEVAFDALNVHLPYARDAAASHRISFAPNNWNSSMPALPLMSYITAFLISGLPLAKLFNVVCYLACGGVTYWFARRWWSPLHGAAAALLVWSSPVALYEATTALVDLPLTLYSAVAVFSVLEWTRRQESSYLWLSAATLGMALSCKYHAALWFIPILFILGWHCLRGSTPSPRQFARLALAYSVIAAAVFLPWLVRTWYYTGNPVFPVANSFFASPFFTPAMEKAALAMYDNEGVGRSWQALAQLPWTVTFHPGPFRGNLGVLFLPGVVLALVRGKNPQIRFGLALAGAYFYLWALTLQEIRYLLPLAPLLSVLTAFGLLGNDPATGQSRPRLAHAGLVLILCGSVMSFPSLYPLWTKEWTYWHSYQSPLPYLMGRETREDFMRRDVPSVYVYDFINEKLASPDRILLLNDASQFYSRVPTLYSYTVEGEEILLQETADGVVRKLKESRITHVLLNYNGIAPLPGVVPRQGVYFFLDRTFQEKHLRAIYSANNVVLYRLANDD
jgi:Dolichyl-phosphate-mannose-protein mannosyltransferase